MCAHAEAHGAGETVLAYVRYAKRALQHPKRALYYLKRDDLTLLLR